MTQPTALPPAYAALEALMREAGLLRAVCGTLEWDRYAWLPSAASASRAEQLALLQRLVADRVGAPETAELIRQADGEALSPAQRLNLREIRRDHALATAVPADLAAALVRASNRCERAWREARDRRDFDAVAPALAEVVALTRESAVVQAGALGLDLAYDALLERWEPGLRQPALTRLVAGVADLARPLVAAVASRRAQVAAAPGPVDVARQRAFMPRFLAAIGYTPDLGLAAESAQPCFSDDTPDDVRITVRYDVNRPLAALRGALHECGHALYERQVPASWRYQPLGRPRSGGLQESQALIWEVHVGGTQAFLDWLAPKLSEAWGQQVTAAALAPDWRFADLSRDRHDSGELGYLLHLGLRCELEPLLLEGGLAVDDLPDAWAEAAARWLGTRPAADARGVLADIHWYRGLFGYFPSYLSGAAAAAQLMDAARIALPSLDADLCNGRFEPLVDWLDSTVHSWGSQLSTEELITRATGHPPGIQALARHLQRRHIDEVQS